MRKPSMLTLALLCCSLAACDGEPEADAGPESDAGQRPDTGPDFDAGPESDAGPDATDAGPDSSTPPIVDGGVTECNDGIDNDGDGLTDWQRDLGCWGPGDATEAARPRGEEAGFTTFDIGTDSVVVYVAEDGDDSADGASPDAAVATLGRAAQLVRDGESDFILLRRGDTWRDPDLPQRFFSGRDATHPMVIASYGDSTERPRLELSNWLINHNGRERSFVALIGLHLFAYELDPDDPAFTGDGAGAVRYIGGGSDLLIEDCHLEYTEIVVQSSPDMLYERVEIRRNVVEKAYHADTCSPGNPNGSPTYRPSGMYASHVDGLLIEGNLFDHNGWNEDVPSACATIYNHNLYLNGNDVVIRDNVLSRASSIHIKLRSDSSDDMDGLVVENNFFIEGEIGVSLGGNSSAPRRFTSSTLSRNVLSDIGRSRPTTRSLAWGFDLSDNAGTEVRDNLFLNQREDGVGNSYGLNVAGDTNRDVTVEDNLFYRIQRSALRMRANAAFASVRVADNDFVDPDQDACLIDHEGAFAATTYAGNRYTSSAAAGQWFCGDDRMDLSEWSSASGESDAQAVPAPSFPDAERTLETYAASVGLAPSLEAFLAEARLAGRLRYRPDLGAPAINDYVRAGFGR